MLALGFASDVGQPTMGWFLCSRGEESGELAKPVYLTLQQDSPIEFSGGALMNSPQAKHLPPFGFFSRECQKKT